jgi:hypothetical protein
MSDVDQNDVGPGETKTDAPRRHDCGCLVQDGCNAVENRDREFVKAALAIVSVEPPKAAIALIAVGVAMLYVRYVSGDIQVWIGALFCVLGGFGLFLAHTAVYISESRGMRTSYAIGLAALVSLVWAGAFWGGIWTAAKGLDIAHGMAAQNAAPVASTGDGNRVEPTNIHIALTNAPRDAAITTMDNVVAKPSAPPPRRHGAPSKRLSCPSPMVAAPTCGGCAPVLSCGGRPGLGAGNGGDVGALVTPATPCCIAGQMPDSPETKRVAPAM